MSGISQTKEYSPVEVILRLQLIIFAMHFLRAVNLSKKDALMATRKAISFFLLSGYPKQKLQTFAPQNNSLFGGGDHTTDEWPC